MTDQDRKDQERKDQERKDQLFEQALAAWTPEMSIRKLMEVLPVSYSQARQLVNEVRQHLADGAHE